MSRFQKNNLIFRIASSDAISKFKAAQAHSFLQLARKELSFGESAREAVLLEFDRFSHWIFKIEKMCVSVDEGNIPLHMKKIIFDSLSSEFSLIEGVMTFNMDVFDINIIDFVKAIHKYTEKIYLDVLVNDQEIDASKYFTYAVSKINDYLQHLMVSMHEYNNNVIKKSETPFLCITDFCINITDDRLKTLPCDTRSEFFIKNGSKSEFVLKNYSDIDIFDTVSLELTKKGITIRKEELSEIL